MTDRGNRWKLLTGSDVTELRDVSVGRDKRSGSVTLPASDSAAAGKTWTKVGSPLRRQYTEAIRVDRTKPATVLVGGEEGIFRTEDAGKTWKLAPASVIQVMNIEQSPHDACFWLAATQHAGLFASRDCGRRFPHVNGFFSKDLREVSEDSSGWIFARRR